MRKIVDAVRDKINPKAAIAVGAVTLVGAGAYGISRLIRRKRGVN